MLPSIRQHGAYITKGKQKAIELVGLIDNDEAEELRRVNNPRGQTILHYEVVNYSTRHYPHAITTPNLGDNEIKQFSRLASMNKGYRKGQPDLEL